MPEIREGLYALNAGEISKNALAHVDLAKLRIACEREENLLPLVLGPAMMRPGTEFLGRLHNDLPVYFLEFKKDEDSLALWIASDDGTLQIFDAITDTFVSRVNVNTSINNGNFSGSIAGWTDSSQTGASIFWQAGFLALQGNGVNFAIASQTVAITTPGVEHALRIKVFRGDVVIKIGSAFATGDYWNIEVPEGEYSLAFVPGGSVFYVSVAARSIWVSLVESIQVELAGRVSLTHPWIISNDLQNLQYDRSDDVLFVACRGHQQRRLERRNTLDLRSWAIANYRTDDGPFMTANIGTTTLAPSGTTGAITLIASQVFFHSGHAGALFRLTHSSQEEGGALTGANQFTQPIRITGVEPGRAFAIVILGQTGSTLTLQRSFTDPGAWVDVQDYTANGSFTFDDALDNQIFWYRIGIKTGNYSGEVGLQAFLAHTGSQTGIVRIVDVIDQLTATANVLTHLGGTVPTNDWAEGEWSDYRGWPLAVALHDGRLFWQDLVREQGSVSDAFHSFDSTVIGDSAPINRTTVQSRPHWVVSSLRMVIGSTLHEVTVKASAFDEPLTPTAFVPRICGDHGAVQMRAVVSNGQVVYVSRDGKRIFALVFDATRNDYVPQELTRLNQEICQGVFIDVAVQQQPDTRFYLVDNTGRLIVLVHEPNEDVSALVPFTFESSGVERVACLPGGTEDRVYVCMLRAAGRCLERFARRTEAVGGPLNKVMDGHVAYTGAPITTLAGLDHLEGISVVAWADGQPLATRGAPLVVNAGAVSWGTPASSVVVGQPYNGSLKTAKLAYASQRGTSLGQQKRVGPIGLIMNNLGWAGVRVGRDFDHLTALPGTYRGRRIGAAEVLSEWDQAPSAFSGGWTSDPRICIEVQAPYPCTILGIAFGEQINEGEDVPAPRER